MTYWVLILALWLVLSLAWWALVILSVTSHRPSIKTGLLERPRRSVSVLKPIPAQLSDLDRQRVSDALASFAASLDGASEMILGCWVDDVPHWQAQANELKLRYPDAQIILFPHANPISYCANPKVSWMKLLAKEASGELLYWSDADVFASPRLIFELRKDYETRKAALITSPFIIEEVTNASAVLDALYVNLELYPRVLLAERLNLKISAMGAGMLMPATSLHEKVDLDELGSYLADDYQLGRCLGSVALGSTLLQTTATDASWGKAFEHYRRWQKTQRWNEPFAYFRQLLLIPFIGWFSTLLATGEQSFAIGSVAIVLVESVFALVLCRALDCRLRWPAIVSLPLWSAARALTWLLSWLPLPVAWRNQVWMKPKMSSEGKRETGGVLD